MVLQLSHFLLWNIIPAIACVAYMLQERGLERRTNVRLSITSIASLRQSGRLVYSNARRFYSSREKPPKSHAGLSNRIIIQVFWILNPSVSCVLIYSDGRLEPPLKWAQISNEGVTWTALYHCNTQLKYTGLGCRPRLAINKDVVQLRNESLHMDRHCQHFWPEIFGALFAWGPFSLISGTLSSPGMYSV